nr:hypothetical protein [Ktedonobacter racemifer]
MEPISYPRDRFEIDRMPGIVFQLEAQGMQVDADIIHFKGSECEGEEVKALVILKQGAVISEA